jgi:hypothetical protein
VLGQSRDGHAAGPSPGRRFASLHSGGVAALVAGVAHALQGALLLWQPRQPQWTSSDDLAYGLFAVGVLSALVSVLSLVRCWSGRIGGTGLVGAAVAIGGLGLLGVVAVTRIVWSEEVLDPLFIVGFLCLLVGYAIFGSAAGHRHQLAFWQAFLPLAGAVGALVLQDRYGAGIWMGLAWGTLGARLLARSNP